MTYMTTASRRYLQRRKPSRPRVGLSDWMEDLMNTLSGQGSQESQCLDTANATVAPFDAAITDMAKNWNPTGFYTSQDVRDVVSSAMAVVTAAQNAVSQAAAEPNASQDSVMRATDDLANAGAKSLDYLQAANAIDAQGIRVINAPGFKRWVTDTLGAASSAIVTAAVIGCITPWWVGALATFQSAFDAVRAVVTKVVGAVIAIGETVLKVADDLPNLYDILKWVALAGGAYWLYVKYFHDTGHPTT